MTTCQHCGAEMPSDLKLCRECGASMGSVRSCPSCIAPDEGGRFCGNCGVAVTVGATAEGMVACDAVNTASRVQSAADPGFVWVDDTTWALTAAAVSYIDVGEHWLKGKSEPARLWQARPVVADLGGGQRVDGLEVPLVGREGEVRLIKELFHAMHESQRPRLVVLDGEPGVVSASLAT